MNNSFLNSVKKLSDFFIYYYFLVDLFLLGFFSKKIPYLFFIFSYIYGTFGYTNALTDFQFIIKAVCLLFSWYMIYTSLIVFCVFNIPISQKYLTNLLGKDFVVDKIGNPGLGTLARFSGFAFAGFTVNEVGRLADSYIIVTTADTALENRMRVIENNEYLSLKEKKQATQESLKLHDAMVQTKPEGTLDRISKVGAHRDMVSSTSDVLKTLFGKK